MHDSSQRSVCSASPTPAWMSDEEFSAFMAACREEVACLQPNFRQRIQGGGQ